MKCENNGTQSFMNTEALRGIRAGLLFPDRYRSSMGLARASAFSSERQSPTA
jgi:hypothetical protein